MLIDSHCHLDRLDLSRHNGELSQVIADATQRGVERMLCVCISAENRKAVLSIAEQHETIFASAGIHPCDVGESVVSVETLKSWIDSPKVVAFGETGLDYFHSQTFVEQQKISFKHHLIAAGEADLPVIVHTRDARQDTLELIKTFGNLSSAGVLHCFTEDWGMAKAAIEMNYMISLSGIVTFKNAADLREVAKKVPLEHLLVETDSPYLAPVPYRGKPNFPTYVREVAEFIAELKGISYEGLCEATADNFFRLFKRAY